ncbi:hypothetical protein DFP72DRAFT_841529 [Ephemerocybe angulata]|uniref:Uncharacterized protein n=1 Tax=Ephemerocybe angulata TaxID=980116 RepID=A0A8H6MFK1_9AGAR|nr:hypothetical protein DFP72DRAFT_841529 [Tulosesus angulatus]
MPSPSDTRHARPRNSPMKSTRRSFEWGQRAGRRFHSAVAECNCGRFAISGVGWAVLGDMEMSLGSGWVRCWLAPSHHHVDQDLTASLILNKSAVRGIDTIRLLQLELSSRTPWAPYILLERNRWSPTHGCELVNDGGQPALAGILMHRESRRFLFNSSGAHSEASGGGGQWRCAHLGTEYKS